MGDESSGETLSQITTSSFFYSTPIDSRVKYGPQRHEDHDEMLEEIHQREVLEFD